MINVINGYFFSKALFTALFVLSFSVSASCFFIFIQQKLFVRLYTDYLENNSNSIAEIFLNNSDISSGYNGSSQLPLV